MTRTKIVSVDFNPWAKLIWTERLPVPLPNGYTGGRRVRQYRLTIKNCLWLYRVAAAAGFAWSQDSNGTHMRRV